MTREEAIEWLEIMKEDAIFEQYDALKMAIEALQILGESGIVNCCGCIHWNMGEHLCKLTDRFRADFDYCSDGRREP